jgi:solute:Na+ symporter, SSS family
MALSFQIGAISIWDGLVVVAYLAGITAMGAWFMRGQRTTRDFFLAGRTMGWIPIGISVMSTNFSAITMLGNPGYIIQHDLVYLLRYVAYFWGLPLTVWLFLRFYYRMEIVSVYQYIGRRFDARLRTVTSGIFLVLRGSWMATAQYALGLALTQILGIDLWVSIVATGIVVAAYSAMGGIEGDIWTDVIQGIVMLGALIVVITLCALRVPDGLPGIWQVADESNKLRFVDFSFDLSRTSTIAMFASTTLALLTSYGVDQVIVQRYLTAKDFDTVKRSIYSGISSTLVIVLLTSVVGVSVFGFYTTFPERLPPGLLSDQWLPAFIVHELPVGMVGLVVAGLAAATMSSTDSGVNSFTAVFITDLYRPWREARRQRLRIAADPALDQRSELRLARWLTIIYSFVTMIAALFVGKLGTLFEITHKLNGVISGVLLAVFLAAVLSTRTNASGALLGAATGAATILAVAFGTDTNFFWYTPTGCTVTLVSTWVFSRFFPAPPDENLDGLTLARRDRPIASVPTT